ncbi:hypothetical protein [Rosistilla oblonga]|uniref:Uncharacterized protein n=1 Tax=Rosistilla oblonga TaxID=2527990 RepID=A0A518IW67_9BACT|nr:hypothetical protein [Rosistilla oblonga]QDV57317.1 hypothetical protein Mal33_33210 [Rosistilla oblonga]
MFTEKAATHPPRDRTSNDNPAARRVRFVVAVAAIGLLNLSFAAMVAFNGDASATKASLLFLGHLALQAILIIQLAKLLYRQHGVRQLRFGVSALMILTAICALPMGVVRIAMTGGSAARADWAFYYGLTLVFALFPLLVVCEAGWVWRAAVRKRRQSR